MTDYLIFHFSLFRYLQKLLNLDICKSYLIDEEASLLSCLEFGNYLAFLLIADAAFQPAFLSRIYLAICLLFLEFKLYHLQSQITMSIYKNTRRQLSFFLEKKIFFLFTVGRVFSKMIQSILITSQKAGNRLILLLLIGILITPVLESREKAQLI